MKIELRDYELEALADWHSRQSRYHGTATYDTALGHIARAHDLLTKAQQVRRERGAK